MIRNFQLISLLVILILLCASCSKTLYPARADSKAIVEVGNTVQKYNMKLDLMRTHLSGIFILRQMESGEIRMVATTPFGMSLFDFGLKDDQLVIYKCIEPMRKNSLLKLFENDFKMLFLPNREVKKTQEKADHTKYVSGGGLSKSVIYVYSQNDSLPTNIHVNHSWLRLFMKFEKIEEENAHVTE